MSTVGSPSEISRRQSLLSLLAWVVVSFSAASSSIFVRIDDWYLNLSKPTWNPPPWLFGPVWSILYLMMGIAAWLLWRHGGWSENKSALRLFLCQLVLNWLWTPLFFGLHQPGLAFVEIVLFWLLLCLTIAAFWKKERVAGLILLPYLAWVSFAGVLNYTIWRLNS